MSRRQIYDYGPQESRELWGVLLEIWKTQQQGYLKIS